MTGPLTTWLRSFRQRKDGFSPQMKWDLRFLILARTCADFSKDPSTQCGAVVVDGLNRTTGMGFNGLARGVHDWLGRLFDRKIKYQLVLHAESNALDFAHKTDGCSLYVWPFEPCPHCASRAIQCGIRRIVVPTGAVPEETYDRYRDSRALAEEVLSEAGIQLIRYDKELLNHPSVHGHV